MEMANQSLCHVIYISIVCQDGFVVICNKKYKISSQQTKKRRKGFSFVALHIMCFGIFRMFIFYHYIMPHL